MNFNVQNYHSLCKFCDKTLLLLKNKKPNPFIYISWLYIINEHPNFLKKYNHLFSKQVIKKWLNFLIKFFYFMISWFVHLMFSFRYKNFGLLSTNIEKEKYDVILISHISNINNLSNEKDFYFGSLQKVIEKNNLSVLNIYLDKTKKNNAKKAIKMLKKALPNRVILGLSMSFLYEIKNFIKIILNSYKIFLSIKKIKNKFHKSIIIGALLENFSGNTRNNHRISSQTSYLFNKFTPRFLVITYEGHAWERIVFFEARKASPQVQCVGYQHSRLFKLQHSLSRSLGKKYDPDTIWTSGILVKNFLIANNSLNLNQISVVGSDRFNYFSNITNKKTENKRKSFTCLVMPEGFISECIHLFELSFLYALKYPETNFIWRLHPEMTFSDLKKHSNIFKNIPKNIKVSIDDLDSDIKRSKYALYRGSTTIFFALSRGLKPIYYQLQNEMNINPLYSVNNRSHVISSLESMNILINHYENNYEKNIYINEISKLLSKMFSPIDSKKIVNYFKKNEYEA